MKIRIKQNASEIYCERVHPTQYSSSWYEKLILIEGKVLEVDTEYLFKDQFNTKPIKNISELGMRIEQDLVDEVIDDERPGKARCNWCGKVSLKTDVCTCCGKTGHLEKF